MAIVTLFNDIQFKIKILTAAVRISVEFNHSDEASEKQHNCTIFLAFLRHLLLNTTKIERNLRIATDEHADQSFGKSRLHQDVASPSPPPQACHPVGPSVLPQLSLQPAGDLSPLSCLSCLWGNDPNPGN